MARVPNQTKRAVIRSHPAFMHTYRKCGTDYFVFATADGSTTSKSLDDAFQYAKSVVM